MVVPLNFNSLSRADQADLLEAEGVFMHSRNENDYTVDRYRINNFLIDVFYLTSTGEAVAVQSFYPKFQQPPIYQMHVPRLSIRRGA